MSRLKHRMETEGVWDQTAYNEEMWYVALLTLPLSLTLTLALALALALTRYVALPGRDAHGISSRVLNYLCHMNSKTLFRYVVDDAVLLAQLRPVSIHVNYHPEKLPRMQDIFARYHGIGPDLGAGVGHDTTRASQGGILAWHYGVGLKSGRPCSEAPRMAVGQGLDGSALARRVTGLGASWAGIKGLHFGAGGRLTTPWGGGQWGRLRDPFPPDNDTLFVDFMGQQHLLTLPTEAAWPALASVRCGDSEKVVVKVQV